MHTLLGVALMLAPFVPLVLFLVFAKPQKCRLTS